MQFPTTSEVEKDVQAYLVLKNSQFFPYAWACNFCLCMCLQFCFIRLDLVQVRVDWVNHNSFCLFFVSENTTRKL